VISALMAGLSAVQWLSLVPGPHDTHVPTGFGKTASDASLTANLPIIMLSVATIVAFCMWTYRAARNLPSLGGRNLKYAPGWAVGWFFVPVANAVMPYFVGAEIWRHSDPMQAHLEPRQKRASPLVAAWWFTLVAAFVVPRVAFGVIIALIVVSLAANQGTQQDALVAQQHYLPALLGFQFCGQVLSVVAAVLAILYVRAVDTYQEAQFERISSQGLSP
jgi:hypothetical protein